MTNPFTPDPIGTDPIGAEPIGADPISTSPTQHEDVETADMSAPGGPAKDSALTPLYAAAGLVEVVATSLRSRLNRSQGQGRTLPETTKSRATEIQQQLRTYRDEFSQGYAKLASRGKPTVDSTLVTVRHLSGRAESNVKAPGSSDDEARGASGPLADQQTVQEPVIAQPVVDPLDPVDPLEPRRGREGQI